MTLRIGLGRSLETQQAVGKAMFDALCEVLAPVQAVSPLAISFEIQEINTDVRWNQNNLRDYLAERQGAHEASKTL